MTIVGDVDAENRNIGVYNKNGKVGQTWDIIYADEMPDDLKKGDMNKDWGFKINVPFSIISNLPDGRYIDLIANELVIKTRNGFPSQEWYFDQKSRTIKSWRTKSYAININGNGSTSNPLLSITTTRSTWWQLFKLEGDNLKNVKDNRVFDVKGGKDEEGNKVQAYKKNGSKAQSWRIVYTTDAEKYQEKGLNKERGIHVNRPFYIVSKMYMERCVEAVGAADLRLRTMRYAGSGKPQTFFLDAKTQTLKSNQWHDRSINIEGNGASRNLYMRTTNARWFQLWSYDIKKSALVNEKGKVMEIDGGADKENSNIAVNPYKAD